MAKVVKSKKHAAYETLRWEIFWMVEHGANLSDGSSPIKAGVLLFDRLLLICFILKINLIHTGDQKAVARYICRAYPTRFTKLASTQTYVCRVMKRVKDALQNGDGAGTPGLMRDQRTLGKERRKPVTDNVRLHQVLEQICPQRNGTVKRALRECHRLQLKTSPASLYKISHKLGFS